MASLRDAESLAHQLIAEHLPTNWTFRFDHAKRRAGACNHTKRQISLSRHFVTRLDLNEVHQTLLHEIAHAQVGARAAHGRLWQRRARELGYTGGRLHEGTNANDLAPWIGTCAAGHEHVRFRRPSREVSCGSCASTFSPEHIIQWHRR